MKELLYYTNADSPPARDMKERIQRAICWLRGHAWNAGHAHGWSGYVTYQCQRCRRDAFSQFDF